jgi:hypothetical protein
MAIQEKTLSQRSEIGASVPRESSPSASAGGNVQFRNLRTIPEESRPPGRPDSTDPLPRHKARSKKKEGDLYLILDILFLI